MNIRRLAGLSITLHGLVLFPALGWASSWQQALTAQIATEYDTNPAMIPAYHGGIWRSTFSPGYTLTGNADANELKAGLAFQIARSSNKSLSQNRDDPSAFLDWRHQGETSELDVSTKYDEASTRVAELNGSGLAAAEATRASRTFSASWSRTLGERSTLLMDGAYSDITYNGGSYVDYVTQSADMTFNYDWSESSTPYLKVSYVDSTPVDGSLTTRRYIAMLGMNWKVSDEFGWTMHAGLTRDGHSGGSTSKQGGAGMQYQGQLSTLALNADRQVVPSGLGGFITADQVTGNWSYDVSELSKTGIDLGWQRNHSLTDNFNRSAGAWLQHELNSFWGMKMYFQRRISGADGAENASSSILGVSLAYTDPDF